MRWCVLMESTQKGCGIGKARKKCCSRQNETKACSLGRTCIRQTAAQARRASRPNQHFFVLFSKRARWLCPKFTHPRFRAFLSRRATHTFVFRSTLWTRTSRHTLLATDLASKKLPYKETKWNSHRSENRSSYRRSEEEEGKGGIQESEKSVGLPFDAKKTNVCATWLSARVLSASPFL